MEIVASDGRSGFVETTHYYLREDEDHLKCNWEVETQCKTTEWKFDKINFEVKEGI